MRRYLMILGIAATSLLFGSCTALWNSASYGASDLYRTDNRTEVANRLKAQAEAERAEAEARRAQWEARLAEEEAARAERDYYASSYYDEEPSYLNIVADDYQSAYARRLYGFQSPSYRMPSSYYNLSANRALYYASAYDPAFYNVMVSGDQVWVEPKYITSMFGSWGAVNLSFGLYSSPWNFGWSFSTRPCYYSWWGYPHYSWYDWNWNLCYHGHHYHYYDWWWGGYYPHHHHHGYHPAPPRPPQHRPDHTRPGYNDNRPGHNLTTGSGASAGRPNENLNGNRVNTGNRYQSPTSNRVESAANTTTRPSGNRGTVSTGIYNGSSNFVNGGSVGSNKSNGTSTSDRFTRSESTLNTSVNSSSSSSNFRGSSSSSSSSSSNFRGSSSSSTSRGSSFTTGSSTSKGTSVSGGGSTSTRRGSSTSVSSSSGKSSSSSSSFRSSSSSSNRSSSSSSFRSSSSSSASRSTTISGSSSRSSSGGFSSGSSSGGSRSGGGSTSSRR